MTTHAPTLPVAQSQPTLPNQPFFSWIRSETTLFISQIAAIFAFVYGLISLTYYTLGAKREGGETGLFDPATIKMAVDYVHVVVIAVFIVVLIRYLDDNTAGSYRVGLVFKRIFNDNLEIKSRNTNGRQAKTSETIPPDDSRIRRLREFKRRFLWFWCMMLSLYVVFAWDHSYAWVTSRAKTVAQQETYRLVWDSSNDPDKKEERHDVTALPSITQPRPEHFPNATIGMHETPPSVPAPQNDADLVPKRIVAFAFLEFLFNNVSLLTIYFCFLSMHLPLALSASTKRRRRRHVTISSGAIAVFTVTYIVLIGFRWPLTVGDFRAVNAVFDALSGTINAVVLALLIARLDSKLIGLSSRLIGVLYSYAAVQPLFVAFAQGPTSVLEEITAAVLAFVLISKIYFFLIIMYALQTGRMLNYLACFPELDDRAVNSTIPDCDCPEAPYLSWQSDNKVMRMFDNFGDIVYSKWRVGPQWVGDKRERLAAWIRSERCVRASTRSALLSLVLFLIFLFGYLASHGLGANATVAHGVSIGIDALQLLLVTTVVIVLFLLRKDNSCHHYTVEQTATDIFGKRRDRPKRFKPLDFSKYKSSIAVEQVGKFKEYFFWFWTVTWPLYAALLLHELLDKSTAVPANLKLEIVQATKVLAFPFLSFLFGSLNLLFVFWCFVVLQSPAYDQPSSLRQKLLINYSSLVVALIILTYLLLAAFAVGQGSDKSHLIGYATAFDGLTGILSGVVMALLVARLNSKLFRLRLSLISILFIYAAIQPLFVVFELPNPVFRTIETAVLLAATGLKVSFFLIIMYALQSGKMLNYLICFPFLKERVDSIFENQFEIRTSTINLEPKKYTFSIWKKNKVIYSTGLEFNTRQEIDRIVRRLPSLMSRFRKQNQPPPVAGTYWVEIRDPYRKNKLICESIPLRSAEERDSIITESVHNLPHCKYNRL